MDLEKSTILAENSMSITGTCQALINPCKPLKTNRHIAMDGTVLNFLYRLIDYHKRKEVEPGVVADLSRLQEPYCDEVNPQVSSKAGASAPGS
jgi:hypothetical protein